MSRKSYPSDLSDEQWLVLQPLLHNSDRRGSAGRYAQREVVNALLYLLCNGCSWRALPHDFPPYTLVWYHFRRWRDNGTLEEIHGVIRARVRREAGREEAPSAAILDSQSVKATEKGGSKASMRARKSKDANGTS